MLPVEERSRERDRGERTRREREREREREKEDQRVTCKSETHFTELPECGHVYGSGRREKRERGSRGVCVCV